MILKTNYLDSERTENIGEQRFKTTLSNILSQEKVSSSGVEIPRALIDEMESFTERNSLAVIAHTLKNKKPIHICCSRCLKAHMLKKAKELRLNNRTLRVMNLYIKGPIGHNGFYIDKEELKKV